MEEKLHRLVLNGRRELILSGVTEVDSSEDRRIELKTVLGNMQVEGEAASKDKSKKAFHRRSNRLFK